jgi:DNA-binding NtrC family response regulator
MKDNTSELITFFGESKKFVELMISVDKIAKYKTPVFITGETGVGKTLLAEIIHRHSGLDAFVPINCGSLNPDTLEEDLYGCKRGVFAGGNKGGLSQANGGTLFLDEIGDISEDIQAKLLHVLESKKFFPLNSSKITSSDFRLICATNKDPNKYLRPDFLHRVFVGNIEIPPLRERGDDALLLADHFLSSLNDEHDKNISFSLEATELILTHTWPGNIRELKNKIESAFIFCDNSVIEPTDFKFNMEKIKNYKILNSNQEKSRLRLKSKAIKPDGFINYNIASKEEADFRKRRAAELITNYNGRIKLAFEKETDEFKKLQIFNPKFLKNYVNDNGMSKIFSNQRVEFIKKLKATGELNKLIEKFGNKKLISQILRLQTKEIKPYY